MNLSRAQLATLSEAGRAAQRMRQETAARLLRYVRWLPPQHGFLSCPSKRKLLRTGNQFGKTWAGIAEVIYRCRGDHPHIKVRRAPVTAWVICASWSQSIEIQQKFWALVDPAELADNQVGFDLKNGFGAKNPTVRFRNGSVVRFKTTQQGGLNLAGATIDVALFDEPPTSERIYTEVQKRVMRRNGVILLTMTPINAPVEWIRELAGRGAITDHHYEMEPANFIPVGATAPMRLEDGTPMDAAWIQRQRLETLPHEAPVVLDGQWETKLQDRFFPAFRDNEHVGEPSFSGEIKVGLGFDWGSKLGKQVGVLVAVQQIEGLRWPRVAVLDSWVGAENSSIDDDARATLAMLRRRGWLWANVDHAWGDRVYIRGAATKSNKEMMEALIKPLKLKRTEQLRPRLRTVKRGRGRAQGSVIHGCRFLHQCMVRPGHFTIVPAVGDNDQIIESFNKWQGADDDYKDKVDAIRYALQPYVFRRQDRGSTPKLRLYG